MKSAVFVAVLLALIASSSTSAFAPAAVRSSSSSSSSSSIGTAASSTSTALSMANDNDLLRWARSARTAGVDDRVVELKRPLGIVLNEDKSGNVYVETVAARGNAARTGMVSAYYMHAVAYACMPSMMEVKNSAAF